MIVVGVVCQIRRTKEEEEQTGNEKETSGKRRFPPLHERGGLDNTGKSILLPKTKAIHGDTGQVGAGKKYRRFQSIRHAHILPTPTLHENDTLYQDA